MRLADEVRKCVVFIGRSDHQGQFKAAGTGFMVEYDQHRYLVTVRHIPVGLGEDGPFEMRVNKLDGDSDNIHIDPAMHDVRWHVHPDPTVDLAVMGMAIDFRPRGYDVLLIPQRMFAEEWLLKEWRVGPGDLCYAVGLFRHLQGATRNMPIVHTGNIAMMPDDERIPMRNWLSPVPPRVQVEGYLVEMQNLKGLSGSPVLVRPSMPLFHPVPENPKGLAAMQFHSLDVSLLGVWSGSWDAEPDEVLAVEAGQGVRVPVGLGTVVPTSKVIEIMQSPALVEERRLSREAKRSRQDKG